MRRWRRVDRLYFDFPNARPGSLNAYLIAAIAAGVATLLRLAIDHWVEGVQFITCFPLLIAVALICGFRAGVLALILSALLVTYFIIEPRESLQLVRLEDGIAIALYMATGLMLVVIADAGRVAIGRYQALSRSLHRRVQLHGEELERTQASLVQAQKMEAVGQLTGGIAHDFNNMLAVVIGHLDIARRRLAEGRTDVARPIDSAMEGADRAAALTRRLLVFARRQPLEPEVSNVNHLLGGLSDLLRRTLGERIRIETEPAENLWPAFADRTQLESAIINLAINARDAMPNGGTLRIETANCTLDGEASESAGGPSAGDYVRLTVTDSGIGMAPEIAAKAFEPFFTTKEVGRGTGLGLSQVYGFVRQSGGHITIDSAPGAGTRVELYLPRFEGGMTAEEASAAERETPRGSPGEVVLVVEDEDQVRRASIAALAELGYGVREARNGVEALAILASDPAVTLLFTDLVMPGLDGRALAERALRQRPDLKILYTTGYAPEAAAGETLPDGHPAMLRKPFTVDLLARKLRELIDG